MWRRVGTAIITALLAGGSAYAQETALGPGRVEIGAFPGGGLMFLGSNDRAEPDFTNFAVGGSLTVNLNHWVGVESEVGWAPGIHQRLIFDDQTWDDHHTPLLFGYGGTAIVSPFGNTRALVPYLSGGLGALTLVDIKEVADLGITKQTTFLTGLAGGGIKWFAGRNWGVRADYRFFVVKSNDTAPAFFGRNERYAHRVYGGLLLTY